MTAIDRAAERAVNRLGRILLRIACTRRARGTVWGGQLIIRACGHLCTVRNGKQ